MPKPPLKNSSAEPENRLRWRFRYTIILLVIVVGGGLLLLRAPSSPPPPNVPAHSYAQALEQAHNGKPGAARVLYQQLSRTDLSDIRRTSLLVELGNYPSPQALKLASADLHSDALPVQQAAIDAIVRLATGSQRSVLLGPLLDEDDQQTRFNAAKALLSLTPDELGLYFGPLEQVVEEYEGVLASQLPTTQNQIQLATLYLHTGNQDLALKALDQVLKLEPDNLEAELARIEAVDKQGQVDKARELLGQALQRHPESAFLQHALGIWLLRHGQNEYALLGLAKALELEPENTDYRYDLAVALHDLDQLEAAQKQLEEILQREPANRRARVLLIGYWQETGQLQKVQILLAELEQQNPDDPALQQGL